MIRKTWLWQFAAPVLLSALTFANGTHTDLFEGGGNPNGWTFGPGTTLPVSGGHPGGYVRRFLDTTAPRFRCSGTDFTGDFRARGVTNIGVDLRTISIQFPFMREVTVILSDGPFGSAANAVYRLGTEFVPQIAEGWKSFELPIDSQSKTLPAGWASLGGGDADAAWEAVIGNVAQVTIFYGDPTLFFIFDQWTVGADNARITEGGVVRYCDALANSSGAPAAIDAAGSVSIVANDLTLLVSGLPPGAQHTGIFVASPDRAQLPLGDGNVCVGSQTLGFVVRLFPSFASSPAGTASLALDHTNPIQPEAQVTPGSTWNYTAWFRDFVSGGSGFNFSDAIAVTYCP